MTRESPPPARRARRAQGGFTLLELGIVVAIIGILATVVIAGQGFLASSRLSKIVELIDSVQKAAGVYSGIHGGMLPADINLLAELHNRRLIPKSVQDSGGSITNYRVTAISRVNEDHWSISINCTDSTEGTADCKSLADAKQKDDSRTNTALAGATVTFTFEL